MDIGKAIEVVKSELDSDRFEHTLRVIEVSGQLAHRFNGSVEKAKLAAVFHDYAKNWSVDRLKAYILKHDLPKDLLEYHSELWHGPVAAHYIEKEFGVTDEEVLQAIRHHTTGKAGMNKVDKILYLADYIEPGRSFPGLEKVRNASEKHLEFACWLACKNTLIHLIEKNAIIHPDSFYAYNDLTRKIHTEGLLDG